MIRCIAGRSAMTRKNDEPIAPASGEQPAKQSYWDALVAEGFVPARPPKRMTVREGYPEVPLIRYRKEQREMGP
jgi:hypothetical protein